MKKQDYQIGDECFFLHKDEKFPRKCTIAAILQLPNNEKLYAISSSGPFSPFDFFSLCRIKEFFKKERWKTIDFELRRSDDLFESKEEFLKAYAEFLEKRIS